jgi:UV DNA damage endonuclease
MKTETQCVRSNLGLVCITHTEDVRYKTVTRKRLLSFDEAAQAEMLRALYAENIVRLGRAVEFCRASGINLYRMTSALFPFSDEPAGAAILEEFSEDLKTIGTGALAAGLRLVLHPDQYVVLSSDSESVVANSVKILKMHAKTMDLLGQPARRRARQAARGNPLAPDFRERRIRLQLGRDSRSLPPRRRPDGL